ncbi:MAG: hypothetical protein VW082_12900, partial [Candidatus Nanopelagicales bacterium]
TGLLDNIETEWVSIPPWVFWNRPHATLPTPAIAPYGKLYLYFRAKIDAGVGVTLSLRYQTLSTRTGDVIYESTDSASLTTTSTSFLAGEGFFALASGWCAVRILAKTNAAAGQVGSITSASLCNIVKRSH